MRFKQKILTAAVVSFAYYLSSLFLRVVPCQVSPNLPNPQYVWSLCTLNPDSFVSIGVKKIFFGFSSRLTDATILALTIPFLILILFLSVKFTKHKKED